MAVAVRMILPLLPLLTFLLPVAQAASAEPPVLTAAGATAGPGDLVIVAGQGLGPDMTVAVRAAGAEERTAEVVSVAGLEAVVRLPEQLPTGEVFELTAATAAGTAAPIAINPPDLWWVGPDVARPGATVSLYGRNLQMGGAVPALEGVAQPLEVVDAADYRIVVRLPADMGDGIHRLMVRYRGPGGEGRSSRTEPVLVKGALPDWAGAGRTVIAASEFGAVADDGRDDAAALEAALTEAARRLRDEAGAATEAAVQLAPGRYLLSRPVRPRDRVHLRGAGAGATVLAPTESFPEGEGPPFVVWPHPSVTCHEGASGALLSRMTITLVRNTPHPAAPTAVWARGTCGLEMAGLHIEARGGQAFDAHAARRLTLRNSTVVGSGFLGRAHQVVVADNAFHGIEQAGAILLSFGTGQIAITGNTVAHLDAEPGAERWRTDAFQGRFYVGQAHWGPSQDIYIAGNRTVDLAPHIEYVEAGLHANAGEQILFEGAGFVRRFDLGESLSEAEPRAVTLDDSARTAEEKVVGGTLTITEGRGAGQVVTVDEFDPATARISLREPLRILPDRTSIAILTQAPRHVAVVGNTLDGRAENVSSAQHSASAGVQIFPGGTAIVVDGNVLSDLRSPVALFGFAINGVLVGTDDVQIRCNSIRNSGNGLVVEVTTDPDTYCGGECMTGIVMQDNDLTGIHGRFYKLVAAVPPRTLGTVAMADNDGPACR